MLVETKVLLAAVRTNPAVVLREAASTYRVDTDAIALKVKEEFVAKEKTKKTSKPTQHSSAKTKNAA
jgi:ParB family transcriptional regulator, chromosome partitioning protein